MASLTGLLVAAQSPERETWFDVPRRIPEPTAEMSDAEQIAAYTAAGTDLELMTCTHVLHAIGAARIIPADARVLDLGCGPATQMVHLARLRPDIHITGVDLSPAMLEEGERQIRSAGLNNLTLTEGDMTELSFPDQHVHAVVSSMALHHLPTLDHLHRCFAEINRVLSDDGAIYLGDFIRHHREPMLRRIAYRRQADQPEAYTRDFYNSLQAAFSASELRQSVRRCCARPLQLRATWPLRFMMHLSSPWKNPSAMDPRPVIQSLTRISRRELRLLRTMFRLGALLARP